MINFSRYQCRGPKVACMTSAMAVSNCLCDRAPLCHKHSGFFANAEFSEGHFRMHIVI